MKHSKLLASFGLLLTGGFVLAACGPTAPTVKTFDVSFFDAETLLKTVQVEENGKVERWVPEKQGKTFVDWYLTPSLNRLFDFDTAITEDLSLFAAFKGAFQKDTREYYIVGSGISPILSESDWGKNILPTHKMTKSESETENVYTYTLDLLKGDEFQFALDTDWTNQRGFGYLTETKLENGKEAFKSGKTIGEASSQRSNIVVVEPGNYTFTLKTNPADDIYETTHPAYTEAGKEKFNINPFDTIEWTRNGDVKPVDNVVTNYYIKGAKVTNWKDMYNKSTQLVGKGGIYTLERYLEKDDEVMFTSRNTITKPDGTVTHATGTKYLNSDLLDEAAKELFEATPGKNLKIKETGTYTFSYDKEADKLSATLDKTKTLPEADYYLDGTFADGVEAWKGYCFNESYKLVESKPGIFEIKNVEMKAGSEFIIQSFKKGSTEAGEWGTETDNRLGSYNFTFVFGASENFETVDDKNLNTKVLEACKLNITFDEYARMITIKDANAVEGYDLYIKGGMNGWKHEFKADWKLAQDSTNKNVYTITLPFEANWEFGIAKYDIGVKEGNGDFIGKANLGTTGDANQKFVQEGKGNLISSEAGTFKISVNLGGDNPVIDIFAVKAA